MDDKMNQLELIADDFRLPGSDFVHVFRYMVENGSIAKMSGSALKVYVVVKILSGFENGKTTASLDDIASQAGLSKSQVQRAVKELKDLGYLFSERFGRKNTYQIIEKIPSVHKSGSPDAIAEIPYRRMGMHDLVQQIRSEVVKKLAGAEGLRDINIIVNMGTIENININEVREVPDGPIQAEFDVVENLQDIRKNLGRN